MILRAIFNKIAPQWVAKRSRNALKRAVDENWVKTLATEIPKLKELGKHGEAIYDDVLAHAVRSGTSEAFSTIYKAKNDPNHVFTYVTAEQTGYSGIVEPKNVTQISLLYKAIQYGREDIASLIAADPRTDVTISGYSENIDENEGVERRDFCSPLDRVREKGLTKIVAIIEERMKRDNEAGLPSVSETPGL